MCVCVCVCVFSLSISRNVFSNRRFKHFVLFFSEISKIWHSGGLYSYKSWLPIYPSFKSGVFASENGPGPTQPLTLIVRFISDILIGESFWLNSSTACTFPEPWTDAPNISDNSGDVIHDVITDVYKYLGSYGNRMIGDLTVDKELNDTSLVLRFGRFVGTVKPTLTANKFLVDTLGDFRLVSHFGNSTKFISAYFRYELNGKFQEIELDTVTFRRDIKFSDPLPLDESESFCTSLALLKTEPYLTLFTITVVSSVLNINN